MSKNIQPTSKSSKKRNAPVSSTTETLVEDNTPANSMLRLQISDQLQEVKQEILLIQAAISSLTSQIALSSHEGLTIEMIKEKQLYLQRILNFESEKRDLETQLRVITYLFLLQIIFYFNYFLWS